MHSCSLSSIRSGVAPRAKMNREMICLHFRSVKLYSEQRSRRFRSAYDSKQKDEVWTELNEMHPLIDSMLDWREITWSMGSWRQIIYVTNKESEEWIWSKLHHTWSVFLSVLCLMIQFQLSHCCCTGTPFMARLSEYLKYYIQIKQSSDPGWKNVRTLASFIHHFYCNSSLFSHCRSK